MMRTGFTRKILVAVAASGVLLTGCSSKSSGSVGSTDSGPDSSPRPGTSATGNVGSAPVRVASAYAYPRVISNTDTPGVQLFVTTGPDTCSHRFPLVKNATSFFFEIAAQPLTPGTYSVIDAGPAANRVPSEGQADVVFYWTDANCVQQQSQVGTGGTLIVTASDANHVAGTFDVAFGADHVKGSFDATLCGAETPEYGLTCE
jgi:hypothetical protein